MLRIKVDGTPTSELRGWMFQAYSTFQEHESYEAINSRLRKCLRQERSTLCDEDIQLRNRPL